MPLSRCSGCPTSFAFCSLQSQTWRHCYSINLHQTRVVQLYCRDYSFIVKLHKILSLLTESPKANLAASHWPKRWVKAKVKIATKQDRIRLYQEQLNTTIQIPILYYQNYIIQIFLIILFDFILTMVNSLNLSQIHYVDLEISNTTSIRKQKYSNTNNTKYL